MLFKNCFRFFQPIYEEMLDIIRKKYPDCEITVFYGFKNDVLGNDDFWKIPEDTQSFLVIDDCSDSVGSSLETIYRGTAHHCKISVFYISQVTF